MNKAPYHFLVAFGTVCLLLCGAYIFTTQWANARGGHSHGEESSDHTGAESADHGDHEHAADSISHTAWTDRIEWFIELERPFPGQPAQFAAHVTLLGSFTPASTGKFSVVATNGSQNVETQADTPARPGIFTPSITLPTAGAWNLKVTYTGDVTESIEYPIEVREPGVILPEEPAAEEGISLLKEQQWQLPFQTAFAVPRELAEYLPVYGTIKPRPRGHALLIAPIAGRFEPNSDNGAIEPGTPIQPNQIIGFLEPQYIGPEMTTQLVNQSELISSRIQVEREASQSKQQMELAQKEWDRVKSLYEQKAKSLRDVEQAEFAYRLAKESYESAQRLLKRLAVAPTDNRRVRVPLVSPIAGTLTHMQAIAGEYVDANSELFEIIDLTEVWVEAQVHEQDIALLHNQIKSYIISASYPEKRFDTEALVHIGAVIDSETRTLPIIFDLPNPESLFKVGMAVTVYLEVAPFASVLSIPASAVLDEEGRQAIYVQTEGESFEKRFIQSGRKDRGWIEVTKGLEAEERVVTQGAHFVRLASLQTQMPGGHGHPH